MDWAEQTEEMLKSWTQTQQTLWDNWMGAMKDAKPQAASTWEQTVTTWENSVKNILESQALWTRMWARSFSNVSKTGDSAKMVEQAEALTKVWTETQQQLWKGWFALVRKLDPTTAHDQWNSELEKGVQSWQANMQKFSETQAEWLKNWTGK